MEGIDDGHIRADHHVTSLAEVRRGAPGKYEPPKHAGVPQRNGEGVVQERRWAPALVSSCDIELAKSDGSIDRNPAQNLYIPKKCKPGRPKRFLTLEELEACIAKLDLPDRLILRLTGIEGMRIGEVLDIRWGGFEAGVVDIQQRVYRGLEDDPKSGPRISGVSDGTLADLETWRSMSPNTAPDALVFPSQTGETPLWRGNVWRRRIRPRRQEIGLSWASFQVLRRSNAKLMKKLGIDDKVGTDQRGHDVRVSINEYMESDREEKRQAVNLLESAVTRKPEQKLSA